MDPVKIPNIAIVTIESPSQSVSSKYPKIWDRLLTTAKQLYKGAIIPYFLTSRSKVWAPRGQRANRTHAQPILLLESPGSARLKHLAPHTTMAATVSLLLQGATFAIPFHKSNAGLPLIPSHAAVNCSFVAPA